MSDSLDKVRVLFMGTPDIAAVTLRALLGHGTADVVAVVTQPDRKKGRGMRLLPSPVKEVAAAAGIPVYQPDTLRDGAFEKELTGIGPDLIIVAAYGKILPPYVIGFPRFGCINAHASLLPKYRGAAPINRAVMNGDTATGVTAMFMDEGLDTGDVIFSLETAIGPDDTAGDVHDRLAQLAGAAMCRAVDMTAAGDVPRTPQPEDGASYAAKITKEDCEIDFDKPSRDVYNLIRGLAPYPGAFTYLPDGRVLKITGAKLSDASPAAAPGTVVGTAGGGIRVACRDGSVDFTEVVPEGRSKMDSSSFIRGRGIFEGDLLGKRASL